MTVEEGSGQQLVESQPIEWARFLDKGNREHLSDLYVPRDISDEPTALSPKVYTRLVAIGRTFTNVSFQHCIFDSCYLRDCHFLGCDFTGARFIGCNLQRSVFADCKFPYATFERTHLDDDILRSEAPREENLRMRFARTLRMNFMQVGDARGVNHAISLELEATREYLHKSWSSYERYYQKKYPGFKRVAQFFRWSAFKSLDLIWGNGESIVKLCRTILAACAVVAMIDATYSGQPVDSVKVLWQSLINSPAIFLGAIPRSYPPLIMAGIALTRYMMLAFFTALLIRRFSRR